MSNTSIPAGAFKILDPQINEQSEGFVIVPLEALTAPEAEYYKLKPNSVISQKELIAMYTSTVKEINNGDNGPKSLNVKLYNCLAPYAQLELDQITKRNLK